MERILKKKIRGVYLYVDVSVVVLRRDGRLLRGYMMCGIDKVWLDEGDEDSRKQKFHDKRVWNVE